MMIISCLISPPKSGRTVKHEFLMEGNPTVSELIDMVASVQMLRGVPDDQFQFAVTKGESLEDVHRLSAENRKHEEKAKADAEAWRQEWKGQEF